MKKIIAIVALMFSFNAFAALSSDSVNNAGFSRLSEAQKADIIKQVADASSKNGSVEAPNEEKVEKWVKIGSQVGQGLAGAAKELGVAVNDFSKTPVGQLTMALIVWHMMGGVIVHVVAGVLIWVFGLYTLRWYWDRTYPNKITYSKEHKNIFGNRVIDSIERPRIDSDDAAGWIIASGIVVALGLVTIFTF
jgi:hypothetical protein